MASSLKRRCLLLLGTERHQLLMRLLPFGSDALQPLFMGGGRPSRFWRHAPGRSLGKHCELRLSTSKKDRAWCFPKKRSPQLSRVHCKRARCRCNSATHQCHMTSVQIQQVPSPFVCCYERVSLPCGVADVLMQQPIDSGQAWPRTAVFMVASFFLCLWNASCVV